MTYLVMETHRSYCVLMDEDGRIIKAANLGYAVGERITKAYPMGQADKSQAFTSRRALAAYAAAAACLLLAFTALYQLDEVVQGSVYLAINPEIRMDVNRRDAVVGMEGLNRDGEALIEGYKYKKKDMGLAAQELVDRAIDMGYLHPGGQVVIELEGGDGWEAAAGKGLEARLEGHLAGKIEAEVHIGQPADPATDYSEVTNYAQVVEEPQQIVIDIPQPTPAPTSAPTPTPAPVSPGGSGGDSGYSNPGGNSGDTSSASDSGYTSSSGDSGYTGSSGYGGASGYDGAS